MFPARVTVTDVTVTAAVDTPEGALAWEASDDGVHWDIVPTTHADPLPADRTTSFAFARPVTARMFRVRAETPLALTQLELFDLGGDAAPVCDDRDDREARGS